MTIEFESAEPEKVSREKVIIDGIDIGVIWKDGDRYQCTIKTEKSSENILNTSMHGFGDTKKDAIWDAVISAKREAKNMLEAVEELEKIL